MATAASNVQVKFTLRGEDKASATINKVGASMDDFGKHGDRAADRAGKLSTALSSLGDFAGRSEGQFRKASEAAGAFDDVLTVMPGPIGIAVGAIAGLTTVLVLQAKEARENAAALRQAFGEDLSKQLTEVANKLDLNRKATLKFGEVMRETGKTAEELSKEVRFVVEAAEEVGEDGSAAVVEFAEKILLTTTATSRLNAQLKQSIDLTAETAFGQRQAAGAEGDFEKRVKKAQELIAQGRFRMRSLEKQERSAGFWGAFTESRSAYKARRDRFKKAVAEARALVEQGESRLRKIAQDRAEFAKRLREVDKKEQARAWDDAVEKTREANEKIRKQLRKTAKHSKRRRGRRGPTEAQRIDEQLQDEALAELEAEQEKAKKMADLDAWLADNRINNIMRESLARQAAAEKEKQIEKDRRDERLRTASVSIQAADALFGALIQNEKALAPIKLAMTIGESALAFLRAKTPAEKVAAVAAGAVGVAQFAAVMGGGGGAGGLPSVGGAATGPATVGAGAGGGGGGRVVNVTFGNGVVLGNPHEVARTIKGALAVSQGTGF